MPTIMTVRERPSRRIGWRARLIDVAVVAQDINDDGNVFVRGGAVVDGDRVSLIELMVRWTVAEASAWPS